MKALKWIALGLAALVVIVAAVVAYLVATFDPNDYKPRIVELVKRQTGRTLTIDGKIALTFLPKIGVAVGKASLSEPNSSAVFARVEDAHVAVALWPLLSKQVIVDRVSLKGLAVDLVRDKNGRTNYDDLTGQAGGPAKPGEPAPPRREGPPLAVDVGGIEIENANIGWRDERDGTNVRLSNVNLKTDRLASGVPGKLSLAAHVEGAQPKANLQVKLDTGYRIDFATQAVSLSSLDASVTGDAQGIAGLDARAKSAAVDVDSKTSQVSLSGLELTAKTKDGLDARAAVPKLVVAPDRAEGQAITAELAMNSPARTVDAKLRVAPFSMKGSQVQLSRLDIDLTAKQPDLSVQGTLATPVSVDLDKHQAALPSIAGNLALSGKGIPPDTKAVVNGSARADWGAQSAAADLRVKLDESNIDAKLAVQHWSAPAIAFTVVADRLNVDRYFPPAKPAAAPPGAPAEGKAPAGGGAAPAPEQPFDLSPLKALDASGSVKVGALQVSNVKAEQVAMTIKAAGGHLDVNPITANLYQGSLVGSVAVNALNNGFAVKQRLNGVSVGPLLRDAANKDLLEGHGAVALDATTTGTTVTALKKALAGTASAALKDGTIKGVDIVGVISTAQTLLGSKRTLDQETRSGAKTDFSDMTATFIIKNGVAHNEDLLVKSPLVKITGRGDVDIGEGTMDYTASAALTSAATGLGGKDLAQLAGVAVPVRAIGPLANPKYTVDVASIAGEVAKGVLQRELQRRLGTDKPEGGKQGGDAVGDILRGLFGKPK